MRFVQLSFVKNRHGRCLVSMLTIMALIISSFVLSVHTLKSKATESLSSYGLSNPTISNGVTTWDCIYFGNYWQNDTNGDGNADQNDKKEPIKWRVLSVNGTDAFLLADQNLDAMPYNKENKSVTWATCTLRTWLNDKFLNTTFTSTEQAVIKNTTVVNNDNPEYGTEGGENTTDKMYLLSIAEASNTAYGFNGEFITESETREAKNTAYAKERGVDTATSTEYEGKGFWWLRSPGDDSYRVAEVAYSGCGHSYGYDVVNVDTAVRPVLHLDLSSSALWSYAGKVTASVGDDSSQETPTPTPTNSPVPTIPVPTSTSASTTTTSQNSNVGKDNTSSTAGAAIGGIPQVKDLKILNQSEKVKKSKMCKVTLSWKKVTDAKGYQLQYAMNKKFKKKKSVQTKKTKYTIKKLKKKKTYYIRVRAYKMNGKKKVYGKWSTVKKVKIKK